MRATHHGRGDIVLGNKNNNFDFRQKKWVWLLAAIIIVIGIGTFFWIQKQKAHLDALPLVQTEFTKNLAKLGVFYQAWQRDNPTGRPLQLMRITHETTSEYRSRVGVELNASLGFLQKNWGINQVDKNTFSAMQNDLWSQSTANFRMAYADLEEFQYAVNTYFEQLKDKITNTNYSEEELFIQGQDLFYIKRIEARIAIANAALNYGKTIIPEDWILVRSLLRSLGIQIKAEQFPAIREELISIQQQHFKDKQAAIGGKYTPPKEDLPIDKPINPALSSAKPIDYSLTQPDQQLSEGCMRYMVQDTSAVAYYLTEAQKQIEPTAVLYKYIGHSLAKLRSPGLYPEGYNFMVMDVKPTAKSKGFKVGDILYKVNDYALKESTDLNHLLGQSSKDEINVFYIFRDGAIVKVPVKGNEPLGLTISPLFCLFPTVQ